LEIFEFAFREIVDFFEPDIILTQNGADAHYLDPLTHLCTSMKVYEHIPELAHELAHKYCDGRWIATGGGGYNIWNVVPRAWAQIWNVMKHGQPLHGELPAAWIAKWQRKTEETLPKYWHDLPEELPTIPRKNEINEKNNKILWNALKHIHNKNKS